MNRPAIAAFLFLGFAGLSSVRVDAYLTHHERIGGQTVVLQWKRFPVQWFVSSTGIPGISPQQLQAIANRAFQTWQDVPTASITFQFVGFTGAAPGNDDGMNTLGFLDRPDLDDVLGAARLLIDVQSGEFIESDIFFNSRAPWSVAATGETGRFDLESVAVHEIGHLLGLGHSDLGLTEARASSFRVKGTETVMFPVTLDPGHIEGRALKPDDIAGVSDLYPEASWRTSTGRIQGRVRRSGGGVLGAQVVAFNAATGSLIAGFSLSEQGDFDIGGLEPGLHILRVEPIDDGDVESFFDEPADVDVDFKTKYFPNLVFVPRGARTPSFDVEVESK
jgi:hypothetical protein